MNTKYRDTLVRLNSGKPVTEAESTAALAYRERLVRYRKEHNCGAFEAVEAVDKQMRTERLKALRARAGELYTVEACREVLAETLDFMLED